MLPKGVPMLAAASSALRAVQAERDDLRVGACGGERRLHALHRRMGERVRHASSPCYGTLMPRCTAGRAPMVSNQRCRFG